MPLSEPGLSPWFAIRAHPGEQSPLPLPLPAKAILTRRRYAHSEMKSQIDAANHLWFALGELGEWFARLGGAACYRGFRDEEMPIAILILLQARFPSVAPPDSLTQFLSPQFWEACAPVLASVRRRIDSIETTSDEEVRCVIRDFTRFVNTKLRKEEIQHWPAVLAALSPTQLSAND